MKKLLCLALALLTLLSLVACGGGGDTNMHKIMKAVKDDVITDDDKYVYKSADGYQSTDNTDYSEIRAFSDGVNPRTFVAFIMGDTVVIKDATKSGHSQHVYWWAKDTETTYNGEKVSVAANTVSIEVEYEIQRWDARDNKWKVDKTYKAYIGGLDMNDYYENGKFSTDGATVIGDNECLEGAVALLAAGFDGLNPIYTDKGYPIK